MNIYAYCNSNIKLADGSIPVYIAVKTGSGRFFVNTGLHTMEKFSGREFPKAEMNARAKSSALNKYLIDVEEICLKNTGLDNKSLKAKIENIVFSKNASKKTRLMKFLSDYASRQRKEGTKDIYMRTYKRVMKFDKSATLESVNKEWLERYEAFFSDRLAVNTISLDLRNIRTVFNKAIDNELINNDPFRKFKIKSEKVPIRNLSAEQIRKIYYGEISDWQEEYRDMFILSFFMCGINAADLLSCKKLTNGRLVYNRMKTGKAYSIPVIKEAHEIIKRYKGEKFLLKPLDSGISIRSYVHNWNEALKKLGTYEIVKDKLGKKRKREYNKILGNDVDITTYSARYSFASIAAEIDIPRDVIALCLGHSWVDVTSHYIAYDNKKIDDAVRKVVDYVLYGKDYRKKDGQ